MAIAEKLAPPIIDSTIPAFYQGDNNNIEIKVPFKHAKTYSFQSGDGFALKIKTSQSNSFIGTLHSNSIIDDCVVFTMNTQNEDFSNIFSRFKIGQYYKFQLAYTRSNTVGFFSTVATGKFTSQPIVSIANFYEDTNIINTFSQNCIGTYSNSDVSEKPYYYRFVLRLNSEIIEDSDWQIHSFSLDDKDEVYQDSYWFDTDLEFGQLYLLRYYVKTINNLIVSSKDYYVAQMPIEDIRDIMTLEATSNFDNAYISLKLISNDIELNNSIRLSDTEYAFPQRKNSRLILQYFRGLITLYYTTDDITPTSMSDLQEFSGTSADLATIVNNPNSTETFYIIISTDFKFEPISVLIERASDRDNFSSWKKINLINFKNWFIMNNYVFKDYTIEQGIFYQYRYFIIDKHGYLSNGNISNIVYSDFEDIFLFDGKKQVKIRFNPKVSSFKQTILESKIDTIGNKYPSFFRNGYVEYREFPINGLISYIMDDDVENEFFELDKKIYVSGYNDVQMDERIFTQVKNDSVYFIKLERNDATKLKIRIGRNEDILYYSNGTPSNIKDLKLITDANRSNLISDFDSNTTYKYYQQISLFEDKNLKFQKITKEEAQEKFNNGNVWYCTILPWSNLALYHVPIGTLTQNGIYIADENEWDQSFAGDYNYYELVYVFNENTPRDETASFQEIRRNIFATSLTGYTVRMEREFKLKLLNWLNDGKVKMFKSPYEGNYLVRLMNVSLTPTDQLGRMLHSFQCQAYEVDDFNYNNLSKYNIVESFDYTNINGSLFVEDNGNIIEVGSIGINQNENTGELEVVINEAPGPAPGGIVASTVVDTADGTAVNSDIKYGKVAYSQGHRLTGTLRDGNGVGF